MTAADDLAPQLTFDSPAAPWLQYRAICATEEVGMADTAWTDELLDELRETGDQPADAVVREIFENGQVGSVNALMKALVRNDGVPAGDLPPAVRRYLDETDGLPEWAEPETIAVGERFFAEHGPGCVMALACASLPACYAARKGVQVLHLTARLQSDPVRRIGETAQLVLDVMAPGGLSPGGGGVRDAQKVRLMHAAVRHLVAESEHWDPSWGVPINQEDLGGTLMTFSLVVLDALRRLGVSISADEHRAYFHAWNCAGHVMGLDPRLLSRDIAGAEAFWQRVQERQWAPSPEGQAMTKALVDVMEHATPGNLFDGFPSYIVRYLGGDELGDILGVRRQDWTKLFGGPLRQFARDSDAAVDRDPILAKVSAHFSRQLLEGFSWVVRGGQRAPFDIPQALADDWGIRTAAASFSARAN